MNEQVVTPEKKKKRKKHPLFFIIYFILIVAIIIGISVIVKQLADFQQSIEEYKKAAELAQIDISDLVDAYDPDAEPSEPQDPNDTTLPEVTKHMTQAELYEVILDRLGVAHIEALQVVNPDVVGWVYVTATDISYPILKGENDDVYIRSSWMDRNVYLTAGAIFMESQNKSDFSDFNTILYGHRMRNDTMFGPLKYYKDKSYWAKHPSVYIVTPEKIMRYDIYSVYETEMLGGDTYTISFGGVESKQTYIDYTLGLSIYDTGVVPTIDNRLLTLSTCTGTKDYLTRWVIQGSMAQEIFRYSNEAVEANE